MPNDRNSGTGFAILSTSRRALRERVMFRSAPLILLPLIAGCATLVPRTVDLNPTGWLKAGDLSA